MLYRFAKQGLSTLLAAVLLSGCTAATIKTHIPEDVYAIPDGRARIVLTRAKQFAGSGSPLYVMDIEENIDANTDISVRVGRLEVGTQPGVMYMPSGTFVQGGFLLIPTAKATFFDIDSNLDDLVANNTNATIYIYSLNTNPDEVSIVSCGDEQRDCEASFIEELEANQGVLVDNSHVVENRSDIVLKYARVQMLGKVESGDTLVWDREPGLMRIGGLMEADTLVLQPENISIEAGRTYYLDYEIRSGAQWTLRAIE